MLYKDFRKSHTSCLSEFPSVGQFCDDLRSLSSFLVVPIFHKAESGVCLLVPILINSFDPCNILIAQTPSLETIPSFPERHVSFVQKIGSDLSPIQTYFQKPSARPTNHIWLFDQEEPGAGAGAGASPVLSWFSARTSLLFHWQGAKLELLHYVTS